MPLVTRRPGGARAPALALALALISAVAAVLALAAPVRAQGTQISPFAWRGIIEGAYGPAWNHTQRVRMLQWMALHGMNAYIHAPKNDRFESIDWRTPYPAAIQSAFNSEIALAQQSGISWIPNISPARPDVNSSTRVCFSCASDLSAAVAKLQPFLAAGVHVVMVSFDDVQEQLGNAADVAAYKGSGARAFGRANADFLNRLLGALQQVDPNVQLLTVAADYAGTADTPYLEGLRDARLRPEVQVLWTGLNVRSSDFTAQDAAAYGRLVGGRAPMVWENFANDDFNTARLFLGPYQRSHDLSGAVGGFFFNPMNLPDLNMLPLATAADWLRNPSSYDPRASWLRNVSDLAGGDPQLTAELRAFAETSVSSTLSPGEAPTFSDRANAFLSAYRAGGAWPAAQGRLDGELALTEHAAGDLVRLPDPYIAAQAGPFLAAAQRSANAARVGLLLLAAERPQLGSYPTARGIAGQVRPPDANAVAALRSLLASRRSAAGRTLYLYGCRTTALGCPPTADNVLDDFLGTVGQLDAAFSAGAQAATTAAPSLSAGGRPVRVNSTTGAFTLPASACGRPLTATEGSDGSVTLPAPSCGAVRAAAAARRRLSARGRAAACRGCAARRARPARERRRSARR